MGNNLRLSRRLFHRRDECLGPAHVSKNESRRPVGRRLAKRTKKSEASRTENVQLLHGIHEWSQALYPNLKRVVRLDRPYTGRGSGEDYPSFASIHSG